MCLFVTKEYGVLSPAKQLINQNLTTRSSRPVTFQFVDKLGDKIGAKLCPIFTSSTLRELATQAATGSML